MTSLAVLLAALIKSWLVLGVLLAVPLVVWGLPAIDARARGASLGFRLLVFPGVVLLWPVVLWRYLARRPAEEQNAHLRAARSRDTPS